MPWPGSASAPRQPRHGVCRSPFDSDLAEKALQLMLDRKVLATGAMVYIECPSERLPAIPAGLAEFRSKRMGEVHMGLFESVPGQ